MPAGPEKYNVLQYAYQFYFLFLFLLGVFAIGLGLAHYLSNRVIDRARRRHHRFNARCLRFYRRNAYRLSTLRRGYCWARAFPRLTRPQVLALGQKVNSATLRSLFLRHRTYSDFKLSGDVAAAAHHLVFSHVPVRKDFFMDNSAWFSGIQDVIDVATAVNAAQLGIGDATVQFKEALKQSLVVNAALTRQQRKMVEAEIDFEPLFKGSTPVVGDHPVVYALRELTRQVYDKLFQIRSTSFPTLVVGSADREVTNYMDNNAIHHYFHASESKDVERVVLKMLNKTATRIKKNMKKSTVACKRYNDLSDVINDFRESHDLPDNYRTKIDRTYTQLVFEDSIYNFDASMLGDLFSKTHAQAAYGYGIFPDELLFPDMPPSRLYHLRRTPDQNLVLTWRNGYSNGYKHREDSWSTILKNPVIDCGKFALVVEITARIGPFAVFKLLRVNTSDVVVRTFELPEKKKYVRMLDLVRSVDSNGNMKPIRSYFPVFASEYFEALNYCLSIDRKSLTLENTMTYTRRRAGGVSLVTKELLCPWNLPARDFHRFSFSVYLQAKILSNQAKAVEAAGPHFDVTNNVAKFLRKTGAFAFMFAVPVYVMYRWICDNSLQNELVLFPDELVHQEYRLLITDDSKRMKIPFDVELDISGDLDEDIPTCPICYALKGELGKQVVRCEAKAKTVVFEMTTDELKALDLDLACNDEDPAKLADVKERARKAMPVGGFSHSLRVHYIMGGPGCGKSFIIRKLANTKDMIYCPFAKLMSDYKRLDGPDGKYDLMFQTTHRGLEVRGASAIFVDEFTSMPFEYMKMAAVLNGVEDMYIVGDHKQSHVLEGNGEGQYIGSYLDLEDLSRHELCRNFRNPADAVQLLNNVFEYNMQSMSEVQNSFVVCGPDDEIPETKRPINKMGFSHVQCKRENIPGGKKASVRSNQGGTCDISMIYVDADAGDTGNQEAMRIVALSRHKLMCIIKHDDSAYARKWLVDNGLHEGYQKGFVEGSFTKTLEKLAADPVPKGEGLPIHAAAPPASELTKEKFSTNKILASYTAKVTRFDAMKTDAAEHSVLPRWALVFLTYIVNANAALHFLRLAWPWLVLVVTWVNTGSMFVAPVFTTNVHFVWLVAKLEVLSWGFSTHYELWYAQFCAGHDCTDGYVAYTLWLCSLVAWFYSSLWASIWSFHAAAALGFDYFCQMLDHVPLAKFGFLFLSFSQSTSAYEMVLSFGLCVFSGYLCFYLLRSDGLGLKSVSRAFNAMELQRRPLTLSVMFAKFFFFLVSRKWFPLWFVNHPVVYSLRLTLLCLSYWFWIRFFVNIVPIGGGRYLDAVVNQAYIKDYVVSSSLDTSWMKQSFADYLFWFVDKPAAILKQFFPTPAKLKNPDLQTSKDAHKLVDTFINNVAIMAEGFGTSLNTLASATIDGNFYSGVLDLDFVMPFNQRGHPKALRQVFRRFCVGNGFSFSKIQPMQLIQVVASRYFNKKPRAEVSFGSTAELHAKYMVDEFFREHYNCEIPLDEAEVDEIAHEFIKSSHTKKYQEQFKGFDNTDVRVVRFHLKDIFKPKVAGITDFSKPGQGISAWSKDAQVAFGAAARIINARFLSGLKAHAIFDNRMDTEELKDRLAQQMAETGDVAINGVTDYTMFDSQQDRFTQEIERQALRRLGVSEDFIELYYSFRSHYKLIADGLAGRCNFEKPSGEPLTLLGNTLLSAVVTNHLLRGEGRAVIAMKGDDGFKRQNKLHIDAARYTAMKRYTSMTIKVSLEENAEFCGYVICGSRFVDSIYRKMEKVLAHKFRDYSHFCEYRKSLMDWVKKVEDNDALVVAAYNAELYNGGYNQAISAFEALKSITHLDEEQFEEMFPVREEIAVFKSAVGDFTV